MMNTRMSTMLRVCVLLAVIVLLAGAGLAGSTPLAKAAPSGGALPAPAAAPRTASLPLETCTLVGSTRTCDLWARAGTLSLPDGNVVPIWGFTDSVAGAAQLPGPMLIVNQGERVEVNFTNDLLGETVALSFPGQDLAPDLTGVAFGLSQTYVFTPTQPGTFSYEAGLTMNGIEQTAMGLIGALIVRPAGDPLSAYGPLSATAFNDEALLVFSEIDPNFNADPLNYDITLFRPQYWLINGQPYTNTVPIDTVPGNRVLLRYLNAGLQERSIGVLGRHQTVIGIDSSEFPYSYTVVAETMGAGQSLDTMVTVPISVPVGTRYPVYNTGFQQMHNAGGLAVDGSVKAGGMVTFIEVVGGDPISDTGPLASNVSVTPNPTNGAAGITLAATFDETNTGGETVMAWEYFTETVGLPGSGTLLAVAAPATTVSESTLIDAAIVAGWAPGDVTLYVRGQDNDGTWGPLSSTVLDLVVSGPVISGLSLNPNPTNGSLPVALSGTADDRPTGNVDVIAAEYFIDAVGADGTGIALARNLAGPLTGISATLAQPDVAALPEGVHPIYVHAQDALGNWGAFTTIDLIIDVTGPPSRGISLLPSPNNGQQGLNSSSYAVRLMAEVGSLMEASVVVKAEGFIDTVGANGTGFPLMAYDALFNSGVEVAYVDIPLTTIQVLADGDHAINFHAKDSAGNWGPLSSLTLHIDKQGPVVTTIYSTPNPTNGAAEVTLFATVDDTASGNAIIAAAEWFLGTDPGVGNGNPMASFNGLDSATETFTADIDVSGWADGVYNVSVRGRDLAGNWGAIRRQGAINVVGNGVNGILFDNFENGGFGMWDAVTGNASVTPVARLAGQAGFQAMLDGLIPTYLQNNLPTAMRLYRASFLFDPHTADTSGSSHDIFVGESQDGTPLFGIEFRGEPDDVREVRAWLKHKGGIAYTAWQPVMYGVQQIELAWESGKGAGLILTVRSVAGETSEAFHGLDTSAALLGVVKLGPSGQLLDISDGLMYFDSFASHIGAEVGYAVHMPAVWK